LDILGHRVEQDKSENDLKDTDLKLRMTLNAFGDPIHLIDRDFKIQLINPAFTEWLEEIGIDIRAIDKDLFEVFPFLTQKNRAEYESVFTSCETLDTIEFVSVNGHDIVAEIRKIPIVHGDEVTQILTMVRDITKQRKNEMAIRESEQWFRSIFADSPVAINVFDAKGNFVSANQAMLDFAGVSDMSCLSNLNIFKDPNASDELKEKMRRGEQALFEHTFSYDLVSETEIYPTTKTGIAHIYGGVTPFWNESTGEIQGYIIQIVDETSKVEIKRELREREELFRGFFEHSPIAIELFNIDGKLVQANQAALISPPISSLRQPCSLFLYESPERTPSGIMPA